VSLLKDRAMHCDSIRNCENCLSRLVIYDVLPLAISSKPRTHVAPTARQLRRLG